MIVNLNFWAPLSAGGPGSAYGLRTGTALESLRGGSSLQTAPTTPHSGKSTPGRYAAIVTSIVSQPNRA